MDKIFNDYIPNNKIKLFEKYITNLDINNTLNISDILGCCISYSNNIMIAILNLKIREYNIKINRMNTLKAIYNANCRKAYIEESKYVKDIQICFAPFRTVELDYIHQYWNIFNVKN